MFAFHSVSLSSQVHAFLVPRDGRSLVHMDLTMANIMWDPKTLAVSLGL